MAALPDDRLGLADEVRRFFEVTLPAALETTPGAYRSGLCFVMTVEGVGVYTVDLRAVPACRPTDDPSANVSFETTPDVIKAMLHDPGSTIEHYYRGALRVTGNLDSALKVPGILARAAQPRCETARPVSKAAGLESVITPHSRSAFIANHWPDVPLVVHGTLDRFRWLTDMLKCSSTEELLDSWQWDVAVYPRKSGDEFDAPHIPAAQAKSLWKEGYALVFGRMHEHVPALASVLTQLQEDLGLPRFTYGRCAAYATPQGEGSGAHFDANANFVIQLTGEKTWTLAANRHVTWPTNRFVIDGATTPDELVRELESPLPARIPEPNEEVTLRPGSFLFVPRGYWHATKGTHPALSLNFIFDQPCWATLAGDAVRRRLLCTREWREIAWDLDSPHEDISARAREALATLLPRLADDAGQVTVDDMLVAARAKSRPGEPPTAAPPVRDWVKLLTGRP